MPNLLHKLSHLKIDRSRGAAPHKPLLLLCLLELAEEGALSREIMPITGELAFRFSSYWTCSVSGLQVAKMLIQSDLLCLIVDHLAAPTYPTRRFRRYQARCHGSGRSSASR